MKRRIETLDEFINEKVTLGDDIKDLGDGWNITVNEFKTLIVYKEYEDLILYLYAEFKHEPSALKLYNEINNVKDLKKRAWAQSSIRFK